ncbi:hypothetical protein LTR10_014131 [Elasticomyces elasticus]|uniref:Uncharacterized protein n=1 Tax=Exophiala sideris TaxID=1016849 RepID=A0ABR0J394_9EURO|nr:hypothetical protein LTR10_014131 [Elasticomyces elasticus]KAK5026537.1 hypothetical protein LTS07_007471 [Exophiala sideris]KAK5033722.1 hypothetical protein LTR13_006774 [Exophiala sideris]KAK5055545.1 hypothetical protein LTR69_008378 [Exophiala sideris]KAK5180072.1 hypothetical protein LTR44_007548 [Eurotiomycetes sp. CCFEE 6388]
MDDLDLPPLSQATIRAARTPPRPSFLLTRKRTHADYDDDPATSSDPALFSSDEQAPDAENYGAGIRRKRIYKGSWWDKHPRKHGSRKSSRKQELTRNFDSGIFMGNDSSEELLSSDSFTLEDELLRDQQEHRTRDKSALRIWSPQDQNQDQDPDSTPKRLAPKPAAIMSKEHEEVFRIIGQCLDMGKEDVDLSSMSLRDLPNEITSLKTLSKQDEIVPGMLDTGTNLEPQLRLYLANNLLQTFPTPLLELRNLRVLSLRHNRLRSIPPSIRELVNLETLNVAGNQLEFLPFEILELVRFHKLRELRCQSNNWCVNPPTGYGRDEGVLCANFTPLYRRSSLDWKQTLLDQPPNPISRISSLKEVVLRQLAKLDPQNQVDFRALMPSETPDIILDQLDVLHTVSGRRCNYCQRPIVLAAKEQIEWWEARGVFEREYDMRWLPMVPFKRLECREGCSELNDHWRDENDTAYAVSME